jgi:thiol:disulfide interchange protein
VIARLSIICGLALAGFAVWYFDSFSKPDHVTFLRLDPVFLAKAMSSNKPVLIYVASSKDRACQDFDRGPLMDERVIAALDPFARFKLDLTADNNVSTEQLTAFIELGAPPTLIFLSAEGHEVARLTGTPSADSIVAAATKPHASRPPPPDVRTVEDRTRAVEGPTRARKRSR